MISPVKTILEKAINILFPHRCFSCFEVVEDQDGICASCWQKLTFVTKPICKKCGTQFSISIDEDFLCPACIQDSAHFTCGRHLLKFDEHSKKLIHAFKYHDKTILANFFARLLYNKHQELMQGYDMIIPVPMHRWKRVLRMYNQAELFAKALTGYSSIPTCLDILKKTKFTKSQVSLRRKDRYKNLNNTISISQGGNIRGKNIILVDDVMTTGITLKICANLLKEAGARNILMFSIARTYMN